MKLRTIVLALMLCLIATKFAYSDVVELKQEGYLNGEIMSETESTLQFKDSYGNIRTLNKSEVLFLEKEKKSLGHIALPKFMDGWAKKIKDAFGGDKPFYKKFLLPKPSETKVSRKGVQTSKKVKRAKVDAGKAVAASQARKEEVKTENDATNFRSL